MRVSCNLEEGTAGGIVNSFLMEDQLEPSKNARGKAKAIEDIDSILLRFKLGTFRLAKTTMLVFKISKDEVMVIYYSSSQLECAHTNYAPSPSYIYSYNRRSQSCSEPIYRSIIF